MKLLLLFFVAALASAGQAQNLLLSPDFDDADQLTGWQIGGEVIAVWSERDVDGSLSSGSAEVSSAEGGGNGIQQCVPVTEMTDYLLEGWVWIPSEQPSPDAAVGPRFVVAWFKSEDCGALFIQPNAKTPSADAELRDAWQLFGETFTAPSGAMSGRLFVNPGNPDGLDCFGNLNPDGLDCTATAFFDALFVPEPAPWALQVVALAALTWIGRRARA